MPVRHLYGWYINRLQDKDDQEMEATSLATFTIGELETEKNCRDAASWEFTTALPLLPQHWVTSVAERTQLLGQEQLKKDKD